MTKFTNKIALCLLLGLSFTPLAAYSNNSLTQLDIKKSASSDSALNVTIYTSSPYDDNVAVSKKSDNKYVILMPNVSGSTQAVTDLTGLRDVISDIDVKSVQDGENSYTKVTLTTSKPVAIRTAAKRSAPLTPEQKAYKNLIAQSRANKPASSPNTPNSTATVKLANKPKQAEANNPVAAAPIPPKQETKPVNSKDNSKDNNIKEKNTNVIKMDKSFETQSQSTSEINSVFPVQPEKNAEKQDDVLRPLPTQNSSIALNQNTKPLAAKPPVKLNNKIKTNKGISSDMLTTFTILLCSLFGLAMLIKLIRKSIEHTKLLKNSFKENLSEKPVNVNKYDDIVNDTGLNWQQKYQKFIKKAMPVGYQPGVIGQIDSGEYKFAQQAVAKNINQVKKSIKTASAQDAVKSEANPKQLEKGQVKPVNTKSAQTNAQVKPVKANKLTAYNKSANNISPENIPPIKKVKNQDLKPPKASKTPQISQISKSSEIPQAKTTKIHKISEPKSVENKQNKPEINYKKLEESLERTLHFTPELEDIHFDQEAILKQIQGTFNVPVVMNETDKIAEEMHKTKKLKSFANKIALEETKRNLPLPKKSSEIIKSRNIESKHVELGSSSLHTNPRKFDGANLNVGDLIAKSGKFMTKPAKENNTAPLHKDYSTVTIDEFFDNLDYSSSATAPASLASKVADSLGKMSVEPNITQIRQQRQNNYNPNPLDKMVVQSGYKISDDSGFYIVKNKNGNTSLIGRIKDNTTLLKDFGTQSDVKLQVRRDNQNVYMVKANGYRYLVEVNDNKMGVLLEL